MTILKTQRVVTYEGNGATTLWPYAFNIPSEEEARVVISTAEGEETLLTPDLYTIEGLDTEDGGEITYPISVLISPEGEPEEFALSGPVVPVGSFITIFRETNPTQEVNVTNQTRYNANVVMSVWDKLTLLAQESKEALGRIPQLPLALSREGVRLPNPEAGRVLSGRADGEGWENGPSVAAVDSVPAFAAQAAADAAAAEASAAAAAATLAALNAKITISTAAPSGGAEGDLWFQYI